MNLRYHTHSSVLKLPHFFTPKGVIGKNEECSQWQQPWKRRLVTYQTTPISLHEGLWKQVAGGVTSAKAFRAAGMYSGLRESGKKPVLAVVICDVDAVAAGMFTINVVAAAPVVYCKKVLETSKMACAVLTNAGQANAATGDTGYQDMLDCVGSLATVGGTIVRVGGMAKGSLMIHPNMTTMLHVLQSKVRTEVSSEFWLRMNCADVSSQLFEWGLMRLACPLYDVGDPFPI